MCKTDAECANGETCTSGTCTKSAAHPAILSALAAAALILCALLSGCVSLADLGKLQLVVTGRAAKCVSERAAAPSGPVLTPGPKCAAAARCASAAELVIMSEAPTVKQLAAATTMCADQPAVSGGK